MGRRPSLESRPRDVKIPVNDREHAALLAAAGDRPLATWARETLLAAAGSVPEPAEPVWAAEIRAAHAEGLAVADIAARLGCSVGTVYNRLSQLGLRANRN